MTRDGPFRITTAVSSVVDKFGPEGPRNGAERPKVAAEGVEQECPFKVNTDQSPLCFGGLPDDGVQGSVEI